VVSHLEGVLAHARIGWASQAADSVIGGGLQAIEPLRSSTNRMFAGKSCDCTVEVAQLPLRTASALRPGRTGVTAGPPASLFIAGAATPPAAAVAGTFAPAPKRTFMV
jgi:hypothetical protein